jgi:hypothetical protein
LKYLDAMPPMGGRGGYALRCPRLPKIRY